MPLCKVTMNVGGAVKQLLLIEIAPAKIVTSTSSGEDLELTFGLPLED